MGSNFREELKGVLEWKERVNPECPRCGGEMSKKEKRNGIGNGVRYFWSCDRWPQCNGALSLNHRVLKTKVQGT